MQKFFPDKFAQRDINKLKVKCQFSKCDQIILVKDLKVCLTLLCVNIVVLGYAL